MKYLHEYRDPVAARRYETAIRQLVTRSWRVMEVCGGQTHAIMRFGLDQMLPEGVTLLHGPGCPVCVTSIEIIDRALQLARLPQVIFCSFGDMLRVPGSQGDLLRIKSLGGDVRMVYSPLDALEIARKNPKKEVVFFAVGFETTAPANAMAVFKAHQESLENFSLLVSHVLVPPALETLLSSKENRVDGFLAAGHVCTIMGYEDYRPLAQKYRVPIVVTGFEPLDILQGLYLCLKQLEEGSYVVENQYARAVRSHGNLPARKMIAEVFEIGAKTWRGLGEIDQSGLKLRSKYKSHDAECKFNLGDIKSFDHRDCISGQILQGLKKPTQCSQFAKTCHPDNPLGATMVSHEGACAAYFQHRRIP